MILTSALEIKLDRVSDFRDFVRVFFFFFFFFFFCFCFFFVCFFFLFKGNLFFTFILLATKQCLFDPLKPHFYMVKLGVYRGIYYFSYFCLKT